MTQKRLKEIQAETEFDYEPVNVRLGKRWVHSVEKPDTRGGHIGWGFFWMALFIAFAVTVLYLNVIILK